jgi:hypothetical protein
MAAEARHSHEAVVIAIVSQIEQRACGHQGRVIVPATATVEEGGGDRLHGACQ